MEDKQQFEVPEELKELMLDWKVCVKCRDVAIGSVFKARRAIYYGKQAEKADRKFWRGMSKLYPAISDGKWVYSFDTEMVTKG